MRLRGLCFLFFSLFFIVQCQDDAFLSEPIESAEVDNRLVKYFKSFEIEGLARGLEINLAANDITGDIVDIDDSNVAGRCQYGSHVNPHIIIDSEFWAQASEYGKEMIVFHELGHCYLKRDHLEDEMDNGVCASIMRSGKGSCYDNYNQTTREFYLNELFSYR
jgi:hypothetical protein